MRRLALAGVVLSAFACGGDERCDPDASGTICTIAGATVEPGFAGDDGAATDAVMYLPIDTAVAPNGDVWVLDFNNYRVRAIDSHGTFRTVVGNGLLGDSPVSDGLTSIPALYSSNNHTSSLTFAGGYAYLAAWHESRIKRVRLADMTMEVFAGIGVRTKYSGDGGPALDAALDLPSAVAVAPNGDLVVMDQGNQVVRAIDAAGVIRTVAGHCLVEFGTCAAGATPIACPSSQKQVCGLSSPQDMQLLDEACASPCTPGFAGDGGPALDARLGEPNGATAFPAGRIAFDHAGNLIVADTANHRVRKITPSGTITTLAGTGIAGHDGDGGPATQATLDSPVDVAIAADDTIYIADASSSCIRNIDPAGVISTAAGHCSSDPALRGFAGDGGSPLDAKLDRPFGIDLVGDKLYISDTYNNRVRVVNLR